MRFGEVRMEKHKRQVEYVELNQLTPYARNSRTHSAKQVKQLAGSIKEFGFTNPVLIDANNMIVAGHGRVLAAEHLQLKKVPCIRLHDLTETQIRAYVLADNKLAENAAWDEEMLLIEIDELQAVDFDIDIIGFDVPELSTARPDADVLESPERARNPQELLDSYENSTIRQITLIYDIEEYTEMMSALDQIKERNGLSNNTEAVTLAIRQMVGQDSDAND